MIPVEFFDNFILDIVIGLATRDECIELSCKNCEECVYSDRQSGTLSDFMLAAGDHKCPKVVSPAEDSSTTNAKLLVNQDVVALNEEIQKYKFTPHNSPSKENPYANLEITPIVTTIKVDPTKL